MSFPRYPKYKASGVEWLGEVPEHWSVIPFPYAVHFQEGPGIMASDFRDEGVPLLRVSGAQGRWATLEGCNYLDPALVEKRWGHFRLNRGDLVISASASMGTVCEVDDSANGAIPYTGLIRLVGKAGTMTKDFVRSMVASNLFSVQIELLKAGTTIQHFGPTHLRQVKVIRPPLSEQTKIAAFLDRETAKIDGLVAEQRRLIELLKEKRQAVISHAVTKGLNPHAPMKPSGIEWLGDVPEHWNVVRLKYAITKIEQGWSPQCDSEPAVNGEWGVLKVGCGNRDEFDPTEQKALPLDIAPLTEYEIKPGDILMSRGNTRELVGMATLVKQVRPRLLLCDLLYRFKAQRESADSEFLVFSLRSANVRFQIEREATGTSASMKKIGQGTIREFVICLPQLDEQRKIVALISAETAKLDALTAEAERAIALLQERRAALISAAVTGKIDVRVLVAAEAL